MAVIKCIIAIAVGYLLGCVTMGIVISKAFAKFDIREKGSGNAGTTNMLRTLGWVPSLMTFAGDAIKALIACWIGGLLFGLTGAYLAGIACVIGHNWPVFYGFKGGKGVASSFGVLLYTCWPIAISVFVLQIILVALTKTMSIASIASGILNAIMSIIMFWGDPVRILYGLILSFMLFYRHMENIIRLFKHKENKLDFAKINKLRKDGTSK